MTTPMRKCSKCEAVKPQSDFHKSARGKDGLRGDCRSCRKIIKHKENIPDGLKRCIKCNTVRPVAFFAKKHGACDSCRKELVRFYYIANKEKCDERKKKWAKENKEKHAFACSSWAKKNRSKLNDTDSARRALEMKAMPSWLNAIHKAQIQEMYDVAVAKTMQTGVKYEVDHIHPLKGDGFNGLHVPWNLQVISQYENRSKGNSFPKEDSQLFWGYSK